MSLYSESGYESLERRTHAALQYALERARNRHMVMDRRGRIKCCDYELAAVELTGRLKWTRALCGQIEQSLNLEDARRGHLSFFWFSFADKRFAFRRSSPRSFRRLEAAKWYRRGLRGIDYIVILEPSIYASCSRKRPRAFSFEFEPLISWHIHGLAWGDDRQELRNRFDAIEAQSLYEPLIPNLKGCWAKYLSPNRLGEKIGYMCKTPRVVNRVYCKNPDELDEADWEFVQKEMQARPGEHIHYFKLLAGFTLDQLAFGGGEGSQILQRVKAPFIKRANA
jgi:hypothetical protein